MAPLPIPAIIGTLMAAAGVGTLYAAWRRKGRRSALVLGGWGLIAGAVPVWGLAAGPGRGAALAVIVVMLAALAVILATGQWRRRRGNGRGAAALGPADKPTRLADWAGILILAGPFAAFAAVSLGLALMAHAPWQEANRLIAMAFAVVILWSLGIIWAAADQHRLRVGIWLAGLGIAGSALTALG